MGRRADPGASKRWAGGGALALLLALCVPTGASAAARIGVQILPAYFTGEFGSDVATDIYYLPLIFGVSTPRQEFRVTASFLSIRTEEPVLFAGGDVIGRPAAGAPAGPATESGPGDTVLREEIFLVLGDGARRPWVSAIARVKLPTADEDRGLGTGEVDYGPGAALVQPLGRRMSLIAEILYVVRGDPDGVDYRNTRWASVGFQARAGSASSVSILYDSRESVLSGREEIRDLTLSYDHRLSDTVSFRSAVYLGISDTAQDWGASLGFSAKSRE